MISESKFSDGIQRNADRVTHYQNGGDGSGDGGCDCIGLIIGAVKLAGGSWSGLHGSNYAARNRTNDLHEVHSKADLRIHDLVYKAKNPGDSGYDLPARYNNSGDLRDYYHVGVVTQMNPLRITHCTSVAGGIKVDDTIGQWKYAGWLDLVKKDTGGNTTMANQYKVVGGKLKLRKGPGTKNAVLKLIPDGAILNAEGPEEDGWLYVDYEGTLGYCMSKFVEPYDGNGYDDDSVGAAISTAFANVRSALDELEEIIRGL